MDNFRIIYKILSYLEKAMDYDEPDLDMISPETLRITQNRWVAIMKQLAKEGYVEGFSFKESADGAVAMSVCRPVITLKGLEYLHDNSLLKKAENLAKGVTQFISH